MEPPFIIVLEIAPRVKPGMAKSVARFRSNHRARRFRMNASETF